MLCTNCGLHFKVAILNQTSYKNINKIIMFIIWLQIIFSRFNDFLVVESIKQVFRVTSLLLRFLWSIYKNGHNSNSGIDVNTFKQPHNWKLAIIPHSDYFILNAICSAVMPNNSKLCFVLANQESNSIWRHVPLKAPKWICIIIKTAAIWLLTIMCRKWWLSWMVKFHFFNLSFEAIKNKTRLYEEFQPSDLHIIS